MLTLTPEYGPAPYSQNVGGDSSAWSSPSASLDALIDRSAGRLTQQPIRIEIKPRSTCKTAPGRCGRPHPARRPGLAGAAGA